MYKIDNLVHSLRNYKVLGNDALGTLCWKSYNSILIRFVQRDTCYCLVERSSQKYFKITFLMALMKPVLVYRSFTNVELAARYIKNIIRR